jgi:hypothetical protein
MKTTLLVLLGAVLLAIPGAAAADTAASACLVMDSGAAEGALGVQPLPWEGPVNMAVPAPVPLCPEFRPCGSGCTGSNPCSFTDTGRRCCLDSTLTQHCCPVGQTVFRVVCPCVGTACTPATMQTALCF